MYWTPAQTAPTTHGPVTDVTPTTTSEALPAAGSEAVKPAQPSYTVRAHDTLWRIAEQHLGDPLRYHEIVALNPGKVGSDNKIITGVVLVLPADATGLPPKGVREVTVQPGETLTGIAAREGLSGWRQLWQANVGRVQAGGERLGDPNFIKPGWQLSIPAVASAPTAPPPAVTPPSVNTPPPAVTPPPPPPPRTTDYRAADRHTEAEAGPTPLASENTPAPETAPENASEAAPAQDLDDSGQSFPVRTAGGIGALLAAAIIALIAARRSRQQRRRRPGHGITMPTGEAAAVEKELRATADPLSVATVDLALRGLAATCNRNRVALPVVRAGRLTTKQFDLYLAEPAGLTAPWQATADDAVWTLPVDAPLPAGIDAEQIPAPYPSLVCIGQDVEDGHVFLDLEYLGALGIKGDPQRSREIMAALAVELACSRWADDLQVTVVGAYPELEDALETGRIRYLPSVDHILDELTERSERDRRILASAGTDSLNQARAAGVAPGVWTPEIVFLAGETTEHQRTRLSDVVEGTPRVAIAAVTRGEPLGEWCLRLDGDNAVLEPIMLWVRPQRIDDRTYSLMLDVFGTTEEDAPSGTDWLAEPDLNDLPEDAAAEERAEDETAAAPVGAAEPVNGHTRQLPQRPPRVLVLGPVDVADARGTVEPSKRNRLTEFAAFLALNPGVDHAAVDAALWPATRVTHNTRNTAMSKLRRWLGVDSHGEDYLPRYQAEAGYQFSEQVKTDWHAWCDLLPQGPQLAPNESLEQALALVRGRPFDGVRTRRYAWAENAKQIMISAVVDAAYELARRRLMEGQWRAAEQAIVVGLTLEPGMERLWRVRIMAAHSSGNPAAEQEAVERLLAIVDELGGDLEPETEQLLDQLGKPPTRRYHRAAHAL